MNNQFNINDMINDIKEELGMKNTNTISTGVGLVVGSAVGIATGVGTIAIGAVKGILSLASPKNVAKAKTFVSNYTKAVSAYSREEEDAIIAENPESELAKEIIKRRAKKEIEEKRRLMREEIDKRLDKELQEIEKSLL